MHRGGNSGSPVFLREEGPTAGGLQIRFRLIGLVKTHIEGNLGGKVHPSGLCLVESADGIQEVVNHFLDRNPAVPEKLSNALDDQTPIND